jgi:hypothetical protein
LVRMETADQRAFFSRCAGGGMGGAVVIEV